MEWIREEWLAEQDRGMAMMMLMRPEDALRNLAPAYKDQELGMEEIFWSSRYGQRIQ